MSLPIFQFTIVRDNGDVVPNAEVSVVLESTGVDANIFSDRQGNTQKTSPHFADSNGFFQFYASPGDYRITAEDSGSGFSRTWRYVPLFSPDSDITTSTGTQTLVEALDDRLVALSPSDVAGTAATRDAIGAGDLYSRGGILGTVSQSGGVPTGAIIERGSNANGEYVKFADGTMICTNRNTIAPVANTFTAYTWTYPGGSFMERPIVSVTGNSGVEAIQNAQCANFDSNNFTVNVGVVRSTTADTELHSIAIGRWF